ncbi:pyridoxine 5'-phosphate synthase [Desulfacinum hydrothermale DSM 13146]|uniref:Pyridoxine 5'-phosphate synthase n=1 Tax=Desulfacinum hydrothermale DSM 13146 TaxID=1121390 RepID=A0A1W1X1Y6_9BACT|nr:pyridoxine 5'-phosphate synthase [Desulfacinum hydrothermale]SMC17853.1 pyridoxine 5'-phosphate synthase [Desulfacinum hydrothermale DSM 13146]
MARVAINVDHVATVRQARLAHEPDPVTAAALVELAGAHGVVVHLREDRRHIQDRDVEILRKTVKTRLNLEMAATQEMVQLALRIKPDIVTLVPEKRQELTTEGGLDVVLYEDNLRQVVKTLHDGGIPVSLFINPDSKQIKTAHKIEADCVEIHTGPFAEATSYLRRQEEYERVENATKLATKLGLVVHAGHGVDYRNILWLRNIREIEEFSIGHAVIARAVLVGLEKAVREMIALVTGSWQSTV